MTVRIAHSSQLTAHSSQLTAHIQCCPLISVIIPVYNVEKYLDKCINSIVNQTYRNLEIILVDDGSSDNSPAICDEWARKDNRIRVIHQENFGQAHARNRGLDAANGSLIGFIDSDDSAKPEMYQRLYELLTENDADLSMCSLYGFDEKGNDLKFSAHKDEILTGEQVLERMFLSKESFGSPVNKLYRAEIFEHLRFNEGYIHEDTYIAPHIFGRCRKVVLTSDRLYLRLWRHGSTMGRIKSVKFHYKSFRGHFYAYSDHYEYLLSIGRTDLAQHALRRAAGVLRYALRNVNYVQYRKELHEPVCYTLRKMILSPDTGNKLRSVKLGLIWLRSLFRPYTKKENDL